MGSKNGMADLHLENAGVLPENAQLEKEKHLDTTTSKFWIPAVSFRGGGWVVYFARIMGSALEKCLVALDTFVLFVGGFSPSASHVQLQPLFADRSGRRRPSGRLVCAASSEKPSAGGDLDLGILSSICKDLELARRTSRISRQAVARVILLRGVLVTRDPGHLSRILKP